MSNYAALTNEELTAARKAAFSKYYAEATRPCGDWQPGRTFPDLDAATAELDAIDAEIERRNKPRKLAEHTYGTSVFMRLEVGGSVEEISVYLRNDGEEYRTTRDDNPVKRAEIIKAYKELY